MSLQLYCSAKYHREKVPEELRNCVMINSNIKKTALRLTNVHVQRMPCIEPWFLWLTRLDYGMLSGSQLSFHQWTQVARHDMFQSWPYTQGAFVQIVLLQPMWSSKMRKWIPETEHMLTFFSISFAKRSPDSCRWNLDTRGHCEHFFELVQV